MRLAKTFKPRHGLVQTVSPFDVARCQDYFVCTQYADRARENLEIPISATPEYFHFTAVHTASDEGNFDHPRGRELGS